MSESEIKILQRIDRLSRDIKIIKDVLIKPKKKEEEWVSGYVLKELTGWNFRMKKMARKKNLVKYKKENGSYLYLLSSIPNEFKKAV